VSGDLFEAREADLLGGSCEPVGLEGSVLALELPAGRIGTPEEPCGRPVPNVLCTAPDPVRPARTGEAPLRISGARCGSAPG
jgi:hypothetical protein